MQVGVTPLLFILEPWPKNKVIIDNMKLGSCTILRRASLVNKYHIIAFIILNQRIIPLTTFSTVELARLQNTAGSHRRFSHATASCSTPEMSDHARLSGLELAMCGVGHPIETRVLDELTRNYPFILSSARTNIPPDG